LGANEFVWSHWGCMVSIFFFLYHFLSHLCFLFQTNP
jgi:hypothetical protein